MTPSQAQSSIHGETLDQLAAVKTIDDLNNLITGTEMSIEALKSQIDESKASQSQMQAGLDQMNAAVTDMTDTADKMTALKEAIPGAFDTAKRTILPRSKTGDCRLRTSSGRQ